MPTTPTCRRAAFALVPVLILVAFAAACVFSLSERSLRQTGENETRATLHSARSAALAGTRIALGDLQANTGTDDVATAPIPAAENDFPAVGAWKKTRSRRGLPEKIRLTSGQGVFSETQACRIQATGKMPVPAEVPWEYLSENARFAYFIIDESQRASIAKRERDSYLEKFKNDAASLQIMRQQIPRRTRLEHFFSEKNPDSAGFRSQINFAPCEKILLARLFKTYPESNRKTGTESLTFHSQGVPADWQRRRLKTDLTDENSDEEIRDLIPPDALKMLRSPEIPHAGTSVATRPPSPAEPNGFFTHPFPIPLELKLHLGFFNPRTDGQHRARFHVTARFWNPYSYPLLAHGDGRLGLFDVENLPLIRIENQNTGGDVIFSPSDFPVGRFGLVRQTPSDKTTNAYCRIFDTSDQGFHGNATGLHGGEVFLARFPDPRGQNVGLARNLGGKSWKFQKNLSRIDKPPSGAHPGAWFHPAHILRIESLPSFFPASFLIRGDAGTLRQQTEPQDYSAPVAEFRNVPLPPFSFEISGNDYNRAKAGDYDISQANLVWKIRLKAEDAKAMSALIEAVDLRKCVFDFNVPAVRNAFEVLALTGNAASKEATIGDSATTESASSEDFFPFRDRFPNEHRTDSEDAFSCIRFFDTPCVPALSVGALRHGAFENLPSGKSIGSPLPASKSGTANAIFDRAYFSSAAHAKGTLISGTFNINSENENAWAAVLGHHVPAWQTQIVKEGRMLPVGEIKKWNHAFFMLPFSAQIRAPGKNRKIYSDEEFSRLNKSQRQRCFAEQALREPRPERLKQFAKILAELIRERRSAGKPPFCSLEEFADSGILEKALRKSGINNVAGTQIPEWLPSAITQAAIMEALTPTATPRGDTFTVLCRAEILHPFSRKILASSCAEIRVQRNVEFFDKTQPATTPKQEQNLLNRAFGRRYKITSFRWLPHDEL